MISWSDLKTAGDAGTDITNTNICIKAFTTKISDVNSDSYETEENLIYKISPNTKLQDFKSVLDLSVGDKVVKEDIELQNSDIITTNSKLITSDNRIYTLVVMGDITESGNITTTDIGKMKSHLVGLELLDTIKQKAADINYTGTITLTDLSQMKMAMIGLISL